MELEIRDKQNIIDLFSELDLLAYIEDWLLIQEMCHTTTDLMTRSLELPISYTRVFNSAIECQEARILDKQIVNLLLAPAVRRTDISDSAQETFHELASVTHKLYGKIVAIVDSLVQSSS